MQAIPTGRTITLTSFGREAPFQVDGASRFRVEDRGLGRVALRAGDKYVSVGPAGAGARVGLRAGRPGDSETFQWTENVYGDLNLLSLTSHRTFASISQEEASSDSPGPKPDRRDGSCLVWN